MHVQMKIIVWNLTKMYEREMDKVSNLLLVYHVYIIDTRFSICNDEKEIISDLISCINKALEGSEPKSDRELSQINEKKSRAVKEQLELKGKECPTLLPEYRNILEDGILAMFKLIQTENNQKREAKETKVKKLLSFRFIRIDILKFILFMFVIEYTRTNTQGA